jgi:hypothetical protein
MTSAAFGAHRAQRIAAAHPCRGGLRVACIAGEVDSSNAGLLERTLREAAAPGDLDLDTGHLHFINVA